MSKNSRLDTAGGCWSDSLTRVLHRYLADPNDFPRTSFPPSFGTSRRSVSPAIRNATFFRCPDCCLIVPSCCRGRSRTVVLNSNDSFNARHGIKPRMDRCPVTRTDYPATWHRIKSQKPEYGGMSLSVVAWCLSLIAHASLVWPSRLKFD